jgi:hypothetical protein
MQRRAALSVAADKCILPRSMPQHRAPFLPCWRFLAFVTHPDNLLVVHDDPLQAAPRVLGVLQGQECLRDSVERAHSVSLRGCTVIYLTLQWESECAWQPDGQIWL